MGNGNIFFSKANHRRTMSDGEPRIRSKRREASRVVEPPMVKELDERTTVHYAITEHEEAEPHMERDELFDRLVRKDYATMRQTNVIAVSKRVSELMLMQSIPGHAASGHSVFHNIAYYPNATIEDVYDAIGVDAERVRRERQQLIDDVWDYADRALKNPSDKSLSKLTTRDGDPLVGATMFLRHEVKNPLSVLQGMYLASRMDNFEWRRRVQDRFGLVMGGGRSYAINLLEMTGYGESLESLATEEHSEEFIQAHIGLGTIVDQPRVLQEPGVVNGYVRLVRGKGVSDDAAVLTAGLKYGIDAAFGALSTDGCDTYDKSTPVIHSGGQDELLGDYIWDRAEERGIDLNLTDEDVVEFIVLSAINPVRKTLYPDCSQRRFFLKSTDGHDRPYYAARLHKELIEKVRDGKDWGKLPPLSLGFANVASTEFYQVYLDRFKEMHEKELVLGPMFGGL